MGPNNPRPGMPPGPPGQHPNPAPRASLVEDLGSVADDLRQLYTDFGLRPYRVFSVLQHWSGGRVGAGTVAVVREIEFLPTPLVDVLPVKRRVTEGGFTEDGDTWLRQISPRLTEDEVQNLVAPGGLQPGDDPFIEVRMDARDGLSERRRYTVQGPPARDAGGFEWKVRLVKANPDRGRQGETSGERQAFPERLRNPLMAEGD